jgi:sulfonate transport system ATP-binding protein
LLRTLAGLDPPQQGEVRVPSRRSIVFQEPRLLPWRRVWSNVGIGLDRSVARARASKALGEVGLGGHTNVWPRTLSGGEAQRAALARALVREPQLLLLDEPFGSLDALTRIQMHSLVVELHRRHRPAVLLVTHDVEEALVLADRVLVLRDGQLRHEMRPRELFDDRRSLEFTAAREAILSALGVHAEHIGPDAQKSIAGADPIDAADLTHDYRPTLRHPT